MTDDPDRAVLAFRTALAARAEAFEPTVLDVPPHRRRGRWPALVAAAAVVVLLAGVIAVVVGHRRQAAPADDLPHGWRWESYRDAVVAVPDSWGYDSAPRGDWCAATGRHHPSPPAQGYVDLNLPGDAEFGILCGGTPPPSVFAPHLSFLSPRDEDAPAPPSGWSVLHHTVGGTTFFVTTDAAHRALAERILATAHAVRRDPNGCTPSSPLQDPLVGRPRPAFDVRALRDVDTIAVCQYQLDVKGPGLIASQLLTGPRAAAELAALQSAATGGGPNRAYQCSATDRGSSAITLLLTSGGSTHTMYVSYESCSANGADDGTRVRALTRADCPPLFDARIRITEGINAAFDSCQPASRR